MKIALIGDVHFGARAAREEQHNKDIMDFMVWMAGECESRGVNQLSILGDVFEHRDKITLNSLSAATNTFKYLRSAFDVVTVLRGNHDLAQLDALSPCSLEPYAEYVTLVDEMLWDPAGQILYTSWIVSPEHLERVIDTSTRLGAKVIAGHFEFAGFMYNDYTMVDEKHGLSLSTFSHVPLVLTGHFHTTQSRVLQSTGTKCLYLGSPFPTSFTEQSGQHGFWILDTETLGLEQVVYDKIKFIDVTPEQLLAGDYPTAEQLNVRLVMSEQPDKETLAALEAQLITNGFRDTKVAHKFTKTEDALAEQAGNVAVGEIKSIDEIVITHLRNIDVAGHQSVDADLLIDLYTKAKAA